MNRNYFLYLITAIILSGCSNKNAQINGTLVNPVEGEYIYLDELGTDELKSVDSVKINTDGKFSFQRELSAPSFYLLKVNNSNFMTMLLEPGDNIKLDAYWDSLNYPMSITGSAGTELMVEYNRELRKTIGKLTGLNSIYMQNADSQNLPQVIESLDSMAQSYLDEINTYTKKYIDENVGSLVSLVALYQQVAPNVYVLNPNTDFDYFVKVDKSLNELYPEYEPVKSLHEQVQELAGSLSSAQGSPAVGASSGAFAKEISLPSPEGDTIKLSSTLGSVVLLDFWAAWCTPCRMENPNLVAAYNKYHSKGFQIYQVSLDKTRDAWMKGIQDDHLEKWIHVSDLQYWNSIVVPLYGIESIPANFLLDKEGRILATNLRGDQLSAKLEELFGN